jgi:TolB protein
MVTSAGTAAPSHAAVPCATATASAGHGGGGLIVYWSDSPNPSLWSMRPDGSDRHRIVPNRQNAKRPALSPDLRWIAFDGSPPGTPPLTQFHVQLVRVDGTGLRTLAGRGYHTWELDAQWSPDGRRLSFDRMPAGPDWRHSRIWTIRPDGTGARPLGRGTWGRWSPDGTKLVLSATTPNSDGDLFVMNPDGSGRHRLLATPENEQPAAWSPDGKRILFTRFGSDGADVYVMDADGSHVRRLTRSSGDDVAAGWSPDGSSIVFTSDRSGLTQIYMMDPDGCNQRILSPGGTNQFDPSWQ